VTESFCAKPSAHALACLWRLVISPSHNGMQHCYIPFFMLLISNALSIWRGTAQIIFLLTINSNNGLDAAGTPVHY